MPSAATTTRRAPATKGGAKTGPRGRRAPKVRSLWTPPELGDLTFIDMFCGAGGSSLGMTHAGFRLKVGMNHWKRAIETHAANFTYAEHLCEDVTAYPLRRLPRADVLWASPICTEMSPAGGNARKGNELVYPPGSKKSADRDLLDELGYVPAEGFEKTRTTHWSVVDATEIHRFKAVITENVADTAEKWELFDLWIQAMCRLGYRVQIVSANTAHIGGDTNEHAAQWRDRMYCIFTRLDIPVPDVEIRPVALCFECGETVRGVKTWSKTTLKRVNNSAGRKFLVGRYRRDPRSSYGQYWYTCPNERCKDSGGDAPRVEPYVKPAASIIDWSELGGLIGERAGKDALSPNTIARIKAGLRMHSRPIVATVAGNTFERPGYTRAWPADQFPVNAQQCTGTEAVVSPPAGAFRVNFNHGDGDVRVARFQDEPLAACTTKMGDGIVTPPMSVPVGGTWADNPMNLLAGPMRTQMANEKGCESLVVPEAFITVLRSHADTTSMQDPTDTIAAAGNHHFLTVPPGSVPHSGMRHDPFYVMNYSGEAGRDPVRMARSVEEPLGAMTTTHSHGVVSPPGSFYVMNYGNNDPERLAKTVGEPFGPITTKDHHALVVPYYKTRAKASTTGEPLSAVTTHDTFALLNDSGGWLRNVDLDELVERCHYRMLKPRESLRAQRFDEDYVVVGGTGEQTMQAGNAVSANAAQFFGERIAAVLNRTAANPAVC